MPHNNVRDTSDEWVKLLESDQTSMPELKLVARFRELPKHTAPLAFKQTLRHSLLTEQPRRRSFAQPIGIRRSAALMFIALLLITLTALTVARPYSVSAADILARSADAASLQSFQGVMSGQGAQSEYAMNSWQQFVWFNTPNQWRVEYYAAIPTGAVSAEVQKAITRSTPTTPMEQGSLHFQMLLVNNQTDAWSLSAGHSLEHFNVEDVAAQLDLWWHSGLADYSGDTLKDTLDTLKRDYQDARHIGDGTLAGRSAYIIDIVPKIEADQPRPASLAKIRLWIDQATYFQLGLEARTADDRVLWKAAFDSIQINTSVAANVFDFTPPPQLAVYDRRTTVSTSPEQLAQVWLKMASQVNFKVYAPTYVPAYLTGKLPTADTQNTQQTVAQDYASATNPVALTIRQTGLSSKATLGMSGAQETIGSFKGIYQDLGKGGKQLIFANGNTFTVLVGRSEVTKDDLLRVARSLQLVTMVTGNPPQ